ncbi:type VII secretion protein EsaA [Halalkalibacter sp. AB-rgal2]|uniref:type VII secretion protein EsaA n=1 Tax=Halalkalibacter sp. AB-rgal2 TaxID=3242695 RepID=UPI00359E81B2
MMKRIELRLIAFLLLVLVLAAGLSYLALNQVTQTNNVDAGHRMTIALVNEDEGAIFNNEQLAFGDAFVRSVDHDSNHDWFVVSRGVAESGLERQTYDMMIVIPNDFSEKALSMDSISPEPVTLNYKINASENDEIRAEAERAASDILNDFNRRVIDVYFASVITNLHEAQDQVGYIVNEQAKYTATYNTAIQSPLSNYTNQFNTVKDFTDVSRGSFSSLEDTLESFTDRLAEEMELSQSFVSNVNDVTGLTESNQALSQGFYDSLNQFNATINDADAQRQLDQLVRANERIFNQFQLQEESTTIISDAALLRDYFERANQQVSSLEKSLKETLESNMKRTVSDRLTGIFSNAFENELTSLNSLFRRPDRNMNRTIEEHIKQLPSLSIRDIDDSGLSEQMTLELTNVIATARKYNRERPDFDFSPDDLDNSHILSTQIQEIKNRLAETGVIMTNSVELPANEKTGQIFTLSIPNEYELKRLWLTLPGSDEVNYTEVYQENGEVKLPANDEGVFTVRIKLQLKDANSEIDVFQPATWSWDMLQENITDVDLVDEEAGYEVSVAPLLANTVTEGTDEEEPEVDEENGNREEEEDSDQEGREEEQPDEDIEEDRDSEDQEESEDSDESDHQDGDSDEGNDEGNEEEPEPIIEKVTVINNYIHHRVMSPILDDGTQALIHAVEHTISDYQKLSALLEIYFGLDMSSPELRDSFSGNRLSDLATESSLYYLFNVQELDELMTNYVVERVTAGVTAEIREPIEQLYEQVRIYHDRSNRAEDRMDQLVEKIVSTTEQAQIMNQSLSEVLEEVIAWRERSLALIDEQSDVQAADNEEQQAILALSNDFMPLLATSESLSEQAQSNFYTAETVYQTFEEIDNQATLIQESGNELISQAEELSASMTNKLVEDEEFAENFTEVLANSRIGERQNEDLLDFLSSPVQTKNDGVIVSGDTFTPYFIVLTIFIVALFTAYVISTIHQRRLEKDEFEGERTIFSQNTPITIISAGIGIIEGATIGLISGFSLGIEGSQLMLWTLLITTLVLTILLISTYLLRQLKMFGMFLLLAVFGMYLFFTRALGSVSSGGLRTYSPLQYVENVLVRAFGESINYQATFFVLIVLCLIGVLLNLLVFNLSTRSEEMDDEEVSKAS